MVYGGAWCDVIVVIAAFMISGKPWADKLMMIILQRYIARTVVYAAVLLALIIVRFILVSLLGEFKISVKEYSLIEALFYVVMRLLPILSVSPMLMLLSITGLSLLSSYRN